MLFSENYDRVSRLYVPGRYENTSVKQTQHIFLFQIIFLLTGLKY